MSGRAKPLARRTRRYGQGLQECERDIDRIIEAMNDLIGERSQQAAGEVAFNSSRELVLPRLIYGEAGGVLAPAIAGAAAAAIAPLFQALAAAGPGATFPIRILGRSRVYLANPAETVTQGAFAWLSDSVAGKARGTPPATARRWWIGQFASSLVDAQGGVDIHLFLFPQAGGTL
jgi:hypothetical protein